MSIQLLVLAAVAVFLVFKLRSTLGTRTGYEPPSDAQLPGMGSAEPANDGPFEVIEGGGIDQDIADHVEIDSDAGQALTAMKRLEPDFNVSEFLSGARQAYEMILMAYENGDLPTLQQFLAPDVYAGFEQAVEARAEQGLTVDARFIGVREMKLKDARFDDFDNTGELEIRFVGELVSVVRDASGEIVEGDPQATQRQTDIWTFARTMGSDNPNWLLVATGG